MDAVLIAMPDHWHAAIAIDALNAGKDVYVEKPLTRTIEEGPPIVKAARVNNRVCQVGMQQRSGKHYMQAKAEYIDTNKLGKITLARTWWHGNSYHLRKAPASLQKQPSNLDWAHFLGPLKWRDYDPQQYFNWRAYLDFGGGQVTDLFTHWIDVVHMFMGAGHSDRRVGRGRRIPLQGRPHRARHHQRAEPDYPQRIRRRPSKPRWCRASPARHRILRHRGQAVHRPRPLRIPPIGRNAQPVEVKATTQPGPAITSRTSSTA